MALQTPDVGDARLLDYMLKTNKPASLWLRLYTNDYTGVDGSVIADFTVMDMAGYAEADLAAANWTIGTVGNVTTATSAAEVFTMTADTAHSVYGYYVVDKTGSEQVMWSERFSDAPHTIPAGGGTQTITCKITCD
jgi:UDP-glucose 4-epimerase